MSQLPPQQYHSAFRAPFCFRSSGTPPNWTALHEIIKGRQPSIPYAMPNKIAYTVAQILYVFILHCGIQDIINVIMVQNSIGQLFFFWLDTVL